MLIYLPTGRRELNVKVLVDAFNQEKALVGASSVMVKSSRFILIPSAHDWSLDCGLIS